MKWQLNQIRIAKVLATTILTLQLVACGGGSSGGSGASTSGGNVAPVANTGSSTSKETVTPGGDSASSDSSTVAAARTGSFQLSWTAPVSRADGTPLSLADISGFRIYYGKTAGNYEYMVAVRDGTAQAATVKNVPVGTYHVVMTTYDNKGRESRYSVKVSKTVL
jgi:hypothetical protein